jgi:DNA topoisomerase IA
LASGSQNFCSFSIKRVNSAPKSGPPLRNGETAQLHDAKIEDKATRPPPRYNEGTLIETMQNAWRFVDDENLREPPKEAKGIGTPATRAELIGGLKKQGFLVAQAKHIVPTEVGAVFYGNASTICALDSARRLPPNQLSSKHCLQPMSTEA